MAQSSAGVKPFGRDGLCVILEVRTMRRLIGEDMDLEFRSGLLGSLELFRWFHVVLSFFSNTKPSGVVCFGGHLYKTARSQRQRQCSDSFWGAVYTCTPIGTNDINVSYVTLS